MSWRKKVIGLGAGCAVVVAAFTMVPSKASADDAPLTVAPAVYRVDDTAPAGGTGGTVQLVRHRGWYGRGWGWGGYRGYRGYGYGYRGFYRPYYRPFYGAYGPGYGYGYGYPGYGYGYGYRW